MSARVENPTVSGSTADGGAKRLAPPPRALPVAILSIAVTAVAAAMWLIPLQMLRDLDTTDAWRTRGTVVIAVLAGLLALLVIPAVRATQLALQSRSLLAGGSVIPARHVAARAREAAFRALGFALAGLVLLAVALFLLTNDAAIIHTFLSWEQISRSAGEIMKASWMNLWIAIVAEVLILIWGLTLALVRVAPGRALAPLRWLAIAYVDIFRAIPLIILLYLVAFGIPVSDIPVLSDLPTSWLIVLGLTITTSAYVAEVFRAGIESVHWSQTSAAKSLGFGTLHTWRHVIVPQAMRRVMAPLLSYFVGLQKDTALVLVVGAIDAFGQAKIYAGNYFNLSSVTFVAIVFILVTIPQTRLVDYLLARDARKTGVRAL
jgi:polar amino acid transport system permease protein